MSNAKNTRQRILDESLQRFNRNGYSTTTLAEIAEAVGIAEGNLWYHFRTKIDLVKALVRQCRDEMEANRSRSATDSTADDYVGGILSAMRIQLRYRFLLRDYLQFSDSRRPLVLDPDAIADRKMLRKLLGRLEREGMFRRDIPVDLEILARSLWIVTRYWPDYLREQDGCEDVTWTDHHRGFHHHFAVLLPYLTASARQRLNEALERATDAIPENLAAPEDTAETPTQPSQTA